MWRKIPKLTWLTSLMLLFMMVFISLFLVNELLLGVGVMVGLIWWILMLSLEPLLGLILAGKLNVFVHCAKLRTILSYRNPCKRKSHNHQKIVTSCTLAPERYDVACVASRVELFWNLDIRPAFQWPFPHHAGAWHEKQLFAWNCARGGSGWMALTHFCPAACPLSWLYSRTFGQRQNVLCSRPFCLFQSSKPSIVAPDWLIYFRTVLRWAVSYRIM